VFEPASGAQACGEIGMGRMQEAPGFAAGYRALFQPSGLSGRRVLVTAGPTYEAIDPVRGIPSIRKNGLCRGARGLGGRCRKWSW